MKKLALLFLSFFALKTSAFAQNIVVEAEAMNVFYAALDNPFHLAVENTRCEGVSVKVRNDLGKVKKIKEDSSAFVINVPKAGIITLDIFQNEEKIGEKIYRVKPIPDPYPRLCFPHSTCRPNRLGNGTMAAIGKLCAILEDFSFDAKCSITSFEFTYLKRHEEVVILKNIGEKFSPEVLQFTQHTKLGDILYFDNIKCKCSGDDINRDIGSLVYVIH